eukprot:scaffold912_cov187-Ochromonas_danica.AAC.37
MEKMTASNNETNHRTPSKNDAIYSLEQLIGEIEEKQAVDAKSSLWLTRKDSLLHTVPFDNLLTREETITTVASLQDTIGNVISQYKEENKDKNGKVWLRLFPTVMWPNKIPKLPSLKTIQSQLSDESLICSLFDYSGYSFSSEYTLVYKGSFRPTTAYDDMVAVIRKSLLNHDATLSIEDSQSMASYILYRAAWLSKFYSTVLQENFTKYFPHIKDLTFHRRFLFEHIRIYVGHHPGYEKKSSVSSRKDNLMVTLRLESDCYFKDKLLLTTEEKSYSVVIYQDLPIWPESSLDSILSNIKDSPKSTSVNELVTVKEELLHPLEDDGSFRVYLLAPLEELGSERERTSQQASTTINENISVSDASSSSTPPKSSLFSLDGVRGPIDADILIWGVDSTTLPPTTSTSQSLNSLPILSPQPLALPRHLVLERVRMMACSARHMLILSHGGTIFVRGDNSEGALGTGDQLARNGLTPIEIGDGTVKTRMIAAGCGILGCHSMAITTTGVLYGWGLGHAMGRGTVQHCLTPAPISVTQDSSEEVILQQVVCGDGFTACCSTTGVVYSWGLWAHGRLGLGPIPTVTSRRSGANASKLARHLLHPMIVPLPPQSEAIQLAAGHAHVLCLLTTGHVLSWGYNNMGQLGIGPSRMGVLRDSFTPVLVSHFGPPINPGDPLWKTLATDGNVHYDLLARETSSHKPIVSQICCGSYHSVCVDLQGRVYSWGARGAPCLGLGGHALGGGTSSSAGWRLQIDRLFPTSTSEINTMVPYELYDWCTTWSMPRTILTCIAPGDRPTVSSDQSSSVLQVVAGDSFTAMLTKRGRLLLCGNGPAVPPLIPLTDRLEEEAEEEDAISTDETSAQAKEKVDNKRLLSGAVMVTTPRTPSAVWLREIAHHRIHYLGGSAGYLLALAGEEHISGSLAFPLYQALTAQRGDNISSHEEVTLDEGSVVSSSSSLLRVARDADEQSSAFLLERGRPDCLLLVSGGAFLAHKAVLAQRSRLLREKILLETLPTTTTPEAASLVAQIFLPEVGLEAGKVLLYYLYLDVLPRWCLARISLLHSLLYLAKEFELWRLAALCDYYLHLFNSSTAAAASSAIRDIVDRPPMTLAAHLGGLLGERDFADIIFLAEGRRLVAHRFVLESRSPYFRTMFSSSFREGQVRGPTEGLIEIAVPDSAVGLLRVLVFLYTDNLPDASDGLLLEDLLAADR